MDHGSHTFYLAFDWIGGYPRSVTAKMTTLDGADTEDSLSCSLTFPGAVVHANLTWQAGVREVVYTIHGERGAIVVDDDTLRITYRDAQGVQRTEHQEIKSEWMDASHARWFGSLFEQFKEAIRKGEWVSAEAIEALQCVKVITSAYSSANSNCLEVSIPSVEQDIQGLGIGPSANPRGGKQPGLAQRPSDSFVR
jgi:predicted dehydrogenase